MTHLESLKGDFQKDLNSYPVLTAAVETPAPKPLIQKNPNLSHKSGYNLKMIENHGEVS